MLAPPLDRVLCRQLPAGAAGRPSLVRLPLPPRHEVVYRRLQRLAPPLLVHAGPHAPSLGRVGQVPVFGHAVDELVGAVVLQVGSPVDVLVAVVPAPPRLGPAPRQLPPALAVAAAAGSCRRLALPADHTVLVPVAAAVPRRQLAAQAAVRGRAAPRAARDAGRVVARLPARRHLRRRLGRAGAERPHAPAAEVAIPVVVPVLSDRALPRTGSGPPLAGESVAPRSPRLGRLRVHVLVSTPSHDLVSSLPAAAGPSSGQPLWTGLDPPRCRSSPAHSVSSALPHDDLFSPCHQPPRLLNRVLQLLLVGRAGAVDGRTPAAAVMHAGPDAEGPQLQLQPRGVLDLLLLVAHVLVSFQSPAAAEILLLPAAGGARHSSAASG